ncbi:MAG: TetR/AcrR family transcriptional regulator [Brevundimonas sp.]|uniref:TetR/AcrR family transcriptional regulator n=1 Tax=Brevundimonas sp. TaxID=1871086 RepID=UPI002736A93C|nr:TetR/AcrR family transcriptional regulator [Brevundimonas sp.]MDP3403459.1 TetR/AcrR family transcriptional regulator [Brevundimonas sp.]
MTELAMAPPPAALRRGRKSRRQDIVNYAALSFYERGFDRTSVREIAANAGMTSGSIFYHFASKDELLTWVIKEGLKLGHETAERELIGKTTAIAQYRALILGHLKALHDQRHTHKVSVREWDKLTDEARSELKQNNNKYRERWLTVLAQLKADGLLRSDIECARRMLVAALNWTLHYRDMDLMDLGALADQMGGVGLNMDADAFRTLHQRT